MPGPGSGRGTLAPVSARAGSGRVAGGVAGPGSPGSVEPVVAGAGVPGAGTPEAGTECGPGVPGRSAFPGGVWVWMSVLRVFWMVSRNSGLATAAAAPAPSVRDRAAAVMARRVRRFVRCASRLETLPGPGAAVVPGAGPVRRAASSGEGAGCGAWVRPRINIRSDFSGPAPAGSFMPVSASRFSMSCSSWRASGLRDSLVVTICFALSFPAGFLSAGPAPGAGAV